MAAFTLTSISINVRRRSSSTLIIRSSLSQNDDTSPSPSSPSPPPINRPQQSRVRSPVQKKQRKLSLSQIERAIGAGEFRDRNPNPDKKDSGSGTSLLEVLLTDTIEKEENNLEKKLRETGEWLIARTEASNFSGTAGKNVIKTIFLLIIPIWMLTFLIASGTVKLPFSSPFIDDLIM